MKRQLFYFFTLFLFSMCNVGLTISQNMPDIHPLDLEFHRLAVRRFIFSNNIKLNELVPSEIVSFPSMHPAFTLSEDNNPANDENFGSKIEKGKLVLDESCGDEASIYVGNVNPYATYEIDVESIDCATASPTEIGIELACFGLRDKVQAIVKVSEQEQEIFLRIYKDAKIEREVRYAEDIPRNAFKLRVQLYGHTLGIFTEQNGETKYVGHVLSKDNFGDIIDFRKLSTAQRSTFNVISNLKGKTVVNGATSYLSMGIGQADIRLVSNEDLSPYMDDNRLWFTFSCRGIDTSQGLQGVLSLDPSVFDVKFEGVIVHDHGDGLLRNDYASHLFYDRTAKKWKAYTCDFGGSAGIDGRTGTGLVTAESDKDPRRGFSVMKAKRIEQNMIEGHNEDPCIFFDKTINKWRLLTSAFVNNDITSRTYESDTWDGQFTPVAPPITMNSTGTSIQRIGKTHYALMGGHGNLRIHSFPDLKELGELKLDLQPHWPKPAGRVWASIVPLPKGYPYRYVLLTMDRPNFPGIKVHNWSYGALYFYGANPEDISTDDYEF